MTAGFSQISVEFSIAWWWLDSFMHSISQCCAIFFVCLRSNFPRWKLKFSQYQYYFCAGFWTIILENLDLETLPYLVIIEIMEVDQTKPRVVKRHPEEDAKPWRNWKRKSSLNVFLTIEVPTNGHRDLLEFLLNTKNDIEEIIAEEVGVRGALKFYLTVRPQLSRIDPDGHETISTPYLCSTPSIVLQSTDIHEQIDEAGVRIKHLLDIPEGHGSGFSLDHILECQLNIATFDVIGGSSNPPLPKYIQSKNATVYIKNKDNKNFLYCLSYIRKPVVRNAQRASHYTEELNNFDISGINFPVTLNRIGKFEQQNPDFSVNVFKHAETKDVNLIPMYATPEWNRKYHANLLSDWKQSETALCYHQQYESSPIW